MSDSGDTNINYGHQEVGINKGTFIKAPQPSLSSGTRLSNGRKTENGYETVIEFSINGAYASRGLAVLVNRSAVKEFKVGPTQFSTYIVAPVKADDGRQGIFVDPPLASTYRAEVITTEPHSDLQFEAILDAQPNQP